MSKKIYTVNLEEIERESLLKLIKTGVASARKLSRARVLLKADEDLTDKDIASALHVSVATIERIRKRFVEGNLEAALNDTKRSLWTKKLTGKEEAYLIALACTKAPEGRTRWTLRMLADKVVELGITGQISHESIRSALKKTSLNLG